MTPSDATATSAAPASELPVDVATIRASVQQALVQGPVPRFADLEALEGLLRGHVQLLLPHAEEAGATPGLLAAVRAHLDQNMGSGLMSARIHVRQLAHDCRALLRWAEGRQ